MSSNLLHRLARNSPKPTRSSRLSRKTKRTLKLLFVFLLLSLFLVACARASSPVYDQKPAGFGDGIWHGWSAGFILLWDTFFKVEDPTLYAPNNIGYWYNCGYFCIGPLIISLIFGAIAGIFRALQQ